MQYCSPYSCHADNAAYPHYSRAEDKGHYRHDHHAVSGIIGTTVVGIASAVDYTGYDIFELWTLSDKVFLL